MSRKLNIWYYQMTGGDKPFDFKKKQGASANMEPTHLIFNYAKLNDRCNEADLDMKLNWHCYVEDAERLYFVACKQYHTRKTYKVTKQYFYN